MRKRSATTRRREGTHPAPLGRPTFARSPISWSGLVASILASAVLLCAPWLWAGCSDDVTAAGRSGDRLKDDVALSADLDGDGVGEQALVEGISRRLVIRDGDTSYRSREKWVVVEACLGDTDQNGLLEVVTLLDDANGRHLGLFAYMGGEYRERLVTSVLNPRPLSLKVVREQNAGSGDDLLVLTEESTSSEDGVQTTTYRWNGFGFTALPPSGPS